MKITLASIQQDVDLLIHKTPSGEVRNDLTEINMKLLHLIDSSRLQGKDKPYHPWLNPDGFLPNEKTE